MNKKIVFEIDKYPWPKNDYRPKTTIELCYNDDSFLIHFTSFETELRAVEVENNTDVYRDSCMEIFLQFDPANDERYINFEINPNGAMHCSCGKDRFDRVLVDPQVIDDVLKGRTRIKKDRWEAWVDVPVSFIKALIPTYEHKEGAVLRGNCYKCASGSDKPHHGMWNTIVWEKPDFHRPEFFKEIVL